MSDPCLLEGVDFYYDELGRFVFTSAYHLKRGYCCKSGCRHCPFGFSVNNGVKSALPDPDINPDTNPDTNNDESGQ